MIPLTIDGIQNSHSSKDQKGSPLNAQLQILRDYLNYDVLGSELSKITNGMSFDTKAPKNRHHAKLLLEKYKYFSNKIKIEKSYSYP